MDDAADDVLLTDVDLHEKQMGLLLTGWVRWLAASDYRTRFTQWINEWLSRSAVSLDEDTVLIIAPDLSRSCIGDDH